MSGDFQIFEFEKPYLSVSILKKFDKLHLCIKSFEPVKVNLLEKKNLQMCHSSRIQFLELKVLVYCKKQWSYEIMLKSYHIWWVKKYRETCQTSFG